METLPHLVRSANMLTTAKPEGRTALISLSSPAFYYLLTLFSTPVKVWASGRVGPVSGDIMLFKC